MGGDAKGREGRNTGGSEQGDRTLSSWVADVAVACGMTFMEAIDHTYSQLKQMERAAVRACGSDAMQQMESVMVAMAPFWGGSGAAPLQRSFRSSVDKMLKT